MIFPLAFQNISFPSVVFMQSVFKEGALERKHLDPHAKKHCDCLVLLTL